MERWRDIRGDRDKGRDTEKESLVKKEKKSERQERERGHYCTCSPRRFQTSEP